MHLLDLMCYSRFCQILGISLARFDAKQYQISISNEPIESILG